MSKRFGRNQKRALVAQLEQKEIDIGLLRRMGESARTAIRQKEKDLRGMTINLETAIEAIQEARTILGEYFAGLPPTVLEVANIPKFVTLPRRVLLSDVSGCADEFVQTARMVERLEAVEGGAWADDLTGKMHVQFKTPLGDVAYGFNHRTFMGEPKHRVVRFLADQMANHLWHSAQARGTLNKAGVKS